MNVITDLLFPRSALDPIVTDLVALYRLDNRVFLSLHYMGRVLKIAVIVVKDIPNTVRMLTAPLTLPM